MNADMIHVHQLIYIYKLNGAEGDVMTAGRQITPPRVVENSTQAFGKSHPGLGPPRLLENSTQAFGKSHPGFWKTTKFAQTVRLYFLR